MLKLFLRLTAIWILTPQVALGASVFESVQAEEKALPKHDQTESSTPTLLLVDATVKPEISFSWHSLSRGFVRYSRSLDYLNDAGRVPVGDNVEAFAAIGGTRISKAAAHPRGSSVKAGFYKLDPGKPWFVDIDVNKPITITISGVRFNQPVHVPTTTMLMHSKYGAADLESCGLPGDAREGFATGDVIENMNRRTRPGIDSRLGALSDTGPGSVTAAIDSEGLVTVTLSFPYRMLKNLQDPWASELPGTFLEPIHFHFEFEALPVGVEPLDWVQLGKNSDALAERLKEEGSFSVPGTVYPPDVGPDYVAPEPEPAEVVEPEAEETET